MPDFEIITDSTADLPDEYAKKYNIKFIPLLVSFDSVQYFKDKIDIDVKTFYKKFRESKVFPKTSCPQQFDIIESLKEVLDRGKDVLLLAISSNLSGTYNAFCTAAKQLLEDYKDRKIIVIDTLSATGTLGMLAIEAAIMREDGFDLDTTAATINKLVDQSKIVFTVDSLEYLERGGRIGKAAAIAGAILNIKPIILFSNGEVLPGNKIRGRKKALAEVVNAVEKYLVYPIEDYRILGLQSGLYDDIKYVEELFTKSTGYVFTEEPWEIGIVIGVHIGPTAVGIGLIPKYTAVL